MSRPLRVVMLTGSSKPEPWVREMAEVLPEAAVRAWQPDADPADFPADYAVLWTPPAAFFEQQRQLKAVFNLGAGVEFLLAMPNLPEVPLIRLEDAGMANQMAEYVCQAAARHARQLDRYEADMRAGRWQLHKPVGHEEYPVGVMGLGVLGSRVAAALRDFDFPVVGWSRGRHALAGVRCYAGAEEFGAFLAATRILVCVLPLTPDTTGIIDARTLARLRAPGYLINVARGAHVVDADLLAALASGQLAGACLDVFHTEPLPAEHPFWREPAITMTPHISARTLRSTSLRQVADNIRKLEQGLPVSGVVDRARGY